MKKSNLLLPAAALSALLLPVAAMAEDPTPEKRFGLGLSAYNGSAEYSDYDEALVGITVLYRGDRVFVDHDELGFNFTPSRSYRVEALLKRQHFGYDADDAEVFDGMEDRHAIVGLGGRAILPVGIGQLHSELFFNPIDDDDVEGAENGHSASIAWALPVNTGRIEITPSLGYQWYSEEVVDFLYGVGAGEASASRAAFTGEDAGIGFAGVEVKTMLSDNLRLVGGIRYESLPDEISNSPLVDDDNTLRAQVGLSWVF